LTKSVTGREASLLRPTSSARMSLRVAQPSPAVSFCRVRYQAPSPVSSLLCGSPVVLRHPGAEGARSFTSSIRSRQRLASPHISMHSEPLDGCHPQTCLGVAETTWRRASSPPRRLRECRCVWHSRPRLCLFVVCGTSTRFHRTAQPTPAVSFCRVRYRHPLS
jgi:hypothetical protein